MKQLQLIRRLINVNEDYVLVLYSRNVGGNPNDLKIFRKKSQKLFVEAKHYPENLIFFEWDPAIEENNRIFVTHLYCSERVEMCLREEKLPEKKLGTFAEVQQFESLFKRSALRHYNYNHAPLNVIHLELQDLPPFPVIQKMKFRHVIKFSLDFINEHAMLHFAKQLHLPFARLVTEITAHLNGTVTNPATANFAGGGILAHRIIFVNSNGTIVSTKLFVTEHERFGFVYCVNGTSGLAMNILSVFLPLDIFTWLLVLAVIAALTVVIKGTGNFINGMFRTIRTVLKQPSSHLAKFAWLLLTWNFMVIFLSNCYSGSIESFLVVSAKPYIFKDFQELDRNQFRFVVSKKSHFKGPKALG
ncbi:unnamed protein product [Allacma fusca]|uniref:Uncharacterized protein n=1 Tax=Allacma fusca TaxID=39272 RepID=A0A8J2JPZ8_9HEXA|nr:unnamed protein product [Allacma fusca]